MSLSGCVGLGSQAFGKILLKNVQVKFLPKITYRTLPENQHRFRPFPKCHEMVKARQEELQNPLGPFSNRALQVTQSFLDRLTCWTAVKWDTFLYFGGFYHRLQRWDKRRWVIGPGYAVKNSNITFYLDFFLIKIKSDVWKAIWKASWKAILMACILDFYTLMWPWIRFACSHFCNVWIFRWFSTFYDCFQTSYDSFVSEIKQVKLSFTNYQPKKLLKTTTCHEVRIF